MKIPLRRSLNSALPLRMMLSRPRLPLAAVEAEAGAEDDVLRIMVMRAEVEAALVLRVLVISPVSPLPPLSLLVMAILRHLLLIPVSHPQTSLSLLVSPIHETVDFGALLSDNLPRMLSSDSTAPPSTP